MAKSIGGRFNVLSVGMVAGFLYGIYLMKDYKLVKYSPPSPDNFDDKGNWKHGSFFRVKFTDHVQDLELKDEVAATMKRKKEQREAQAVESS